MLDFHLTAWKSTDPASYETGHIFTKSSADNAVTCTKHVNTGNHELEKINEIISLDADGFTVDDGGFDADPNENGTTYIYIAIG